MSILNDFRRLTRSQRHTFLAAFLGWTMDSLDFFLLVFSVKAIATDFHTQPSEVLGAVFMNLVPSMTRSPTNGKQKINIPGSHNFYGF